MKTGMNLLLWTTDVTREHYPLLATLKDGGFDGVEIPLGDGPGTDDKALRRELERLALRCTTVTILRPEHNPISPDPAVRRAALKRLQWLIERTATLGGEVLCGPLHSAWKVFTGRGPTEDERRFGADVLRAAGEAAARAGVRLGIEFLNRFECYFLNTTADTRDLVSRIEHPAVQVHYDTHHAHLEEKDVARAIAGAAKEIGHVHVSENDRGTPGRGQVRWEETFRALQDIGYDGWLVIESFSRLMPEFAAALHIWRDHAASDEEVWREGLRFLKERWASASRSANARGRGRGGT
jgi:D-psicose/D-tagatose/L-ribulose 3-epimerase